MPRRRGRRGRGTRPARCRGSGSPDSRRAEGCPFPGGVPSPTWLRWTLAPRTFRSRRGPTTRWCHIRTACPTPNPAVTSSISTGPGHSRGGGHRRDRGAGAGAHLEPLQHLAATTSAGPVWLKVTPPFCASEAAIMPLLDRRRAYRPGCGSSSGAAGRRPGPGPVRGPRRGAALMARMLIDLQASWTGRVPELEAWLLDKRAAATLPRIHSVVDRNRHERMRSAAHSGCPRRRTATAIRSPRGVRDTGHAGPRRLPPRQRPRHGRPLPDPRPGRLWHRPPHARPEALLGVLHCARPAGRDQHLGMRMVSSRARLRRPPRGRAGEATRPALRRRGLPEVPGQHRDHRAPLPRGRPGSRAPAGDLDDNPDTRGRNTASQTDTPACGPDGERPSARDPAATRRRGRADWSMVPRGKDAA